MTETESGGCGFDAADLFLGFDPTGQDILTQILSHNHIHLRLKLFQVFLLGLFVEFLSLRVNFLQ